MTVSIFVTFRHHNDSFQVIAIYTFSVVWWRTGKGSVRFAWSIVGAIWTYSILFVTISAWRYRWENLFHPTPVCFIFQMSRVSSRFRDQYWCWIAKVLHSPKTSRNVHLDVVDSHRILSALHSSVLLESGISFAGQSSLVEVPHSPSLAVG